MEERGTEQEQWNKSSSQDFAKQVEKCMDSSFMLFSTTVNEKYSELQENMRQLPSKVVSPINKNMIDATHKLYMDISNESVKRTEELKKKLLFRANIVVVIAVLILVLEVVRFIRR